MKETGHIRKPGISVIMGVYNCGGTLAAAVDSILGQTYRDWELILYDDGSTDDTYAVAKAYAEQEPERIRLLHGEENRKLSHALNRCLAAASGELIARMDGDDISHPERLEKQVLYLENHPETDLVGCQMRAFDGEGNTHILRAPLDPEPQILRRNVPVFHATILARRRVFDELGGYTESPRAEGVEDVDLWFRFYEKGFRAATLDEVLYDVRMDRDALKRRTLSRRIRSIRTRAEGFRRLGFPRRWLIGPACLLLLKGLAPESVKRWYLSHGKR